MQINKPYTAQGWIWKLSSNAINQKPGTPFISAYTVNGKRVVSGLYKFYGTYGLPIDMIVDVLRDKKIVIDWVDFITDALKEGMKITTLRAKLECFMPQEFMNRFDRLIHA